MFFVVPKVHLFPEMRKPHFDKFFPCKRADIMK